MSQVKSVYMYINDCSLIQNFTELYLWCCDKCDYLSQQEPLDQHIYAPPDYDELFRQLALRFITFHQRQFIGHQSKHNAVVLTEHPI